MEKLIKSRLPKPKKKTALSLAQLSPSLFVLFYEIFIDLDKDMASICIKSGFGSNFNRNGHL